jgi:hypothetical protein
MRYVLGTPYNVRCNSQDYLDLHLQPKCFVETYQSHSG